MNEEWQVERKKQIQGKFSESSHPTFRDETPESKHFVDCGGCIYMLPEKCNWCTLYELKIPDGVVPLGCGKGEADIPF